MQVEPKAKQAMHEVQLKAREELGKIPNDMRTGHPSYTLRAAVEERAANDIASLRKGMHDQATELTIALANIERAEKEIEVQEAEQLYAEEEPEQSKEEA